MHIKFASLLIILMISGCATTKIDRSKYTLPFTGSNTIYAVVDIPSNKIIKLTTTYTESNDSQYVYRLNDLDPQFNQDTYNYFISEKRFDFAKYNKLVDTSLKSLPSKRNIMLKQYDDMAKECKDSRSYTDYNFKREAIKGYISDMVNRELIDIHITDKTGLYNNNIKLKDIVNNNLHNYYKIDQTSQTQNNNCIIQEMAVPPDDYSNYLKNQQNMIIESKNKLNEKTVRLLPKISKYYFNLNGYVGSLEMPEIMFGTKNNLPVIASILSKKVNNVLPDYSYEDDNIRVSVNDDKMKIVNKNKMSTRLNSIYMYYNGKRANILDAPIELKPHSDAYELPLNYVMNNHLSRISSYAGLTAPLAKQMKINFGVGLNYRVNNSKTDKMMHKINTYNVYDTVMKQISREHTDSPADIALSPVDQRSVDELSEMFQGTAVMQHADPSEVQLDLRAEFDSGKWTIKKENIIALNKIGETLKKHPNLNGIIEGHTDNIGEEGSNQALSERRAESIKSYLVEKYGIMADRLQIEGFGPSRPIADNNNPVGRAKNRRIEGRFFIAGGV